MGYLSAPPMASTISLHSFIGGGNGFGSRPRMKAKSTWKRHPSSLRRRLSRCLERNREGGKISHLLFLRNCIYLDQSTRVLHRQKGIQNWMILSANNTLATDEKCYRKCPGNRQSSMNEVTYLAN